MKLCRFRCALFDRYIEPGLDPKWPRRLIKEFLEVAGDGETEIRQIFESGMDFTHP